MVVSNEAGLSGTGIAGAETIIVGGGIVGCSIAYHLARLGHRDVLVVERGEFEGPPGSTGHAPGLLGRNSASPVMSALASYTADLLASVPRDRPAVTRVGSLEVTRDSRMLAQLERKARVAARNRIHARMVSPDELAELVPYLNVRPLAGGLFVPQDCVVDVMRGVDALRLEAQKVGVRFLANTEVVGLLTSGDRVAGVRTTAGTVSAQRVVIAMGLWGAEFVREFGVELPLFPVQHPYITTEPLSFLAGVSAEASRPLVRDVDRMFYLREHGDRLGYGWYNHSPLESEVNHLRRADLEYAAGVFDSAVDLELFPSLREARVASRLNGVFSMTPDGGPLLGPVAGRQGLWIAEAVWITHAGGVGLAVAEALLGREPSLDISGFGLNRFRGKSVEECRRASLHSYNHIYTWPEE